MNKEQIAKAAHALGDTILAVLGKQPNMFKPGAEAGMRKGFSCAFRMLADALEHSDAKEREELETKLEAALLACGITDGAGEAPELCYIAEKREKL